MDIFEFCERVSGRKLNQSEKQLLNMVENNKDCVIDYPAYAGYGRMKRIDVMLKVIIKGVSE